MPNEISIKLTQQFLKIVDAIKLAQKSIDTVDKRVDMLMTDEEKQQKVFMNLTLAVVAQQKQLDIMTKRIELLEGEEIEEILADAKRPQAN